MVAEPIDKRGIYLPGTQVTINGTLLSKEAEARLVRVVVDEDVNLASMFTLEFAGLDDFPPRTDIELIDDPKLFAIGNEVKIKLGYYEKTFERLITGEITSLEPTFHFSSPPSITVRGYDRRHRLLGGRKSRTFLSQKDSEIAAQIAQDAGLTPSTVDSKITHEYVLQANQTDLEFLQARARQIEYEVVVDDKTLYFRPVSNAKSEVLTLTYKQDLLEFYPYVSAIGQVNRTAVYGWNYKDATPFVGQAMVGDEVSLMGGQTSGAAISQRAFGGATAAISSHPVMSLAEAEQLAKANFNRGVLMLITGEGVAQGRTDLRAGTVIKIDGNGIGKQYRGEYYVTAVSHRFSGGTVGTNRSGYYTHFKVKRDALSRN